MSKHIDDGGPAFPKALDPYPSSGEGYAGMSLRDWFAGQALALIAGRSWDHLKQDGDVLFQTWSVAAYGVADAMLKARANLGASS